MFKKLFIVFIMVIFVLTIAVCGKKETLTENQKSLEVLLPENNTVPGWSLKENPRFFNADNLWEFIDGAADGYISYGFQEVITADFEQKDTKKQAVIDIYQMKDPLNAYGIYAQERNPSYQFHKIGVEGYMSETILNFWSGQYYVKITVFETGEALMQDVHSLASNIAQKIAYTGGEPVQLSYFPQQNLKPHSIQYIPKDVLGQSYFTNGFEAQYNAENKDYKMSVIICDTENAAKEGMTKYKQFLVQYNPKAAPKDISKPGSGGFTASDSFYGRITAVYNKNVIVVVLGAPSDKIAAAGITDCLSKTK